MLNQALPEVLPLSTKQYQIRKFKQNKTIQIFLKKLCSIQGKYSNPSSTLDFLTIHFLRNFSYHSFLTSRFFTYNTSVGFSSMVGRNDCYPPHIRLIVLRFSLYTSQNNLLPLYLQVFKIINKIYTIIFLLYIISFFQ